MGVTQVLQRSTLCAFARAQPVNHPPLTVCAVFAASFSKGKPRMSKKKGGEPEPKMLLGRPSNNLKMGIVGMPNVGKSTLFNTLCKMTIPAENYPFCTIDPHVSRVEVPDERFDKLVEIFKPVSRVPAYLSVTDIAGLVKGAADGEGLGNAFLSHIKAVDGIFQVVRVFTDEDITHVEGSVEPVRDLDIISLELRLRTSSTSATLFAQWKSAWTSHERRNLSSISACCTCSRRKRSTSEPSTRGPERRSNG